MDAQGDGYSKIISDPFDGSVMPIAYIPDWTKPENQDKSKRFEDIDIKEYIPIPLYDALALFDTQNSTKASTILHYTYITPYMGNYTHDYREYAGWHLWVDIRAPIGTPVLSIANGVIVKTVASDPTGDKYVVIRHDSVPVNGEKKTLYSSYLHLSEISISEGTRIKKWDMLGRVGMEGITTTPHLHIQIDTADAPFHPYWPFTSAEAREAKVSFYDAINTGLWQEKALKYTIHPLIFINTYLGGISPSPFSSAPDAPLWSISTTTSSVQAPTSVVAAYASDTGCEKRRFSDVTEKNGLGKLLYPLVDKKCMFRESALVFNSKEIVTVREALINIMKYYGVTPTNGTSNFLDIPIGDVLQWYAQVAYRRGILDWSYAYPERILSRAEFIWLIIKIARPEHNPSQIKIYADIDAMNPDYQNMQDYGFMVRARGGKIYPNTLLTRGMMAQILSGIPQKK